MQGGVSTKNPPTFPEDTSHLRTRTAEERRRLQLSKETETRARVPISAPRALRREPVVPPPSPGPHGTPKWGFTLPYRRGNRVPGRNGDFPKVVHLLSGRCWRRRWTAPLPRRSPDCRLCQSQILRPHLPRPVACPVISSRNARPQRPPAGPWTASSGTRSALPPGGAPGSPAHLRGAERVARVLEAAHTG